MTHHRFLSGASRVARVAVWRIAKAVVGPWAGNPVGQDSAQVFSPTIVDSSWIVPAAAFSQPSDSIQCFAPSVF